MKHLEKEAIEYASGETISNPQLLLEHLAECERCNDLVLFVQGLISAGRQQEPSIERPSIDSVLQKAGLDKRKIADIYIRDFLSIEIESVLSDHPAVEECAVMVCKDEERRDHLVIFVVRKPGEETGVLRRYLREEQADESLPPTSFVLLPKLPRTAKGEVDQEGLRKISPINRPFQADSGQAAHDSGFAYSIVIPAYNESVIIGPILQQVLADVELFGWDAEVIVVNDGSRDDTGEIVRASAALSSRLRVLENPKNRGWGYSVRRGVLDAKGNIVLFMNADPVPTRETVSKMLEAIASGADLVLGSTSRSMPHFAGFLRNPDSARVGCGAFGYDVVRTVFSQQTLEDWDFMPEVLYLAQRSRLKVAHVSMTFAARYAMEFGSLRGMAQVFVDFLKIRLNALTGKYKFTARVEGHATHH